MEFIRYKDAGHAALAGATGEADFAIGMEPANRTVEACTRLYLANLAMWKDVATRAKIPMTG